MRAGRGNNQKSRENLKSGQNPAKFFVYRSYNDRPSEKIHGPFSWKKCSEIARTLDRALNTFTGEGIVFNYFVAE